MPRNKLAVASAIRVLYTYKEPKKIELERRDQSRRRSTSIVPALHLPPKRLGCLCTYSSNASKMAPVAGLK